MTTTLRINEVANMATGYATVLYHHLNPRAREVRALLDGEEQRQISNEEALGHARALVDHAMALLAEMEGRVQPTAA